MPYTREDLSNIVLSASTVVSKAEDALVAMDASEAAQVDVSKALRILGAYGQPIPLPALPEGYRRPGDFKIGWDASDEMIIPDWQSGSTTFSKAQVQFNPDSSATITYAAQDLSGCLQVNKIRKGAGRWGSQMKSDKGSAVLAFFTYDNNSKTELDFEWRGDNVWQLNVHMFTAEGKRRNPTKEFFVPMTDEELSKWHTYEFDLDSERCAFFVDGQEVGRITPADMPSDTIWNTESNMETFVGIFHHGSWAKHDYSDLPAVLDVAGILV